jgi:LysM repeat protein
MTPPHVGEARARRAPTSERWGHLAWLLVPFLFCLGGAESSVSAGERGKPEKGKKAEGKAEAKKGEKDPGKAEGKKGEKDPGKAEGKKGEKDPGKAEGKKGEKVPGKAEGKKGEKAAAPKPGPRKKKVYPYEHIVEKGDSLSQLAERYGVPAKAIQRWNQKKIKEAGHLRAGVKLRIYSSVPVRIKRRATYIVKKGDNLSRIAKALNVSVEHLKAMNNLKGSTLKARQKLSYLLPGPENRSESVGRPSDGRLINGESMPAGPGYTFGRRPNIYGTNESIGLLIEGIGSFMRKYPDGPTVVVGNLSRSTGGKLSPHKSHQSGRDVDLGYMHKAKYQPVESMLSTNAENIDLEKTWSLLEIFLDTGKVKAVFIDYKIQRLLYDYLVKKKVKQSKLEKLFQYPRGKGAEALIKHVKGHHHHVHLRFLCPAGDDRCAD